MQRKVIAIYIVNAAKPEYLLQSFHISFEVLFFTNIDFFNISVQSSAASINYSIALKYIIYALNQS